MIGKSELTQVLALVAASTSDLMSKPVATFNKLNSYQSPRRGKYGRNMNRTCKLLRRLKTTC